MLNINNGKFTIPTINDDIISSQHQASIRQIVADSEERINGGPNLCYVFCISLTLIGAICAISYNNKKMKVMKTEFQTVSSEINNLNIPGLSANCNLVTVTIELVVE